MGDLVAQLDIDPARKAEVDAELWLSEISELSSSDKCREKIDGQFNGLYFEDSGDLISKTSSSSFLTNSPLTSPDEPSIFTISPLKNNSPQKTSHANFPSIMNNTKQTQSEIFRVSISSSAPSTSSQDELDTTYSEIYIWGENIQNNNFTNQKGQTEILTPTLLQTDLNLNSFLDIQSISCGAQNFSILTKNGEIFTWGKELTGQNPDPFKPRSVETLTGQNPDPFERVSCGEFHTCAVTNSGELYTWGDRTSTGTGTVHWIPKRINGTGTMNDLAVRSVSCGTWHTALLTSACQLYTFGDGTFGALGHGNRCSFSSPKVVESLKGMRVIDVSCGAWHTAGVIQLAGQTGQTGQTGGKIFTWGDGDKFRLGQGDKEARVKPSIVPALVDHDFIRVSCGQSLTVGLTSQGEVWTFGSSVYGQLGNPNSDGRNPSLVRGGISDEPVREISVGSYHVAVLTNKNEVFTWGKGTNGRLGHGDFEDRKIPTLVENLRDKTVKTVSCGASFTVAVCLSKSKKMVSTEQAQCNLCRQNFGFTRKKHICHNCGLLHCNNCSGKKSFRANLAPNSSKPYRVCDSCYTQLNNNNISNNNNNNNNNISNNNEKRRNPNFPLVQIKDVALNNGRVNLKRVNDNNNNNNKKGANGSFGFRTRPVSPFSRRTSPPRSATPGGPTRGLSLSKMPAQQDGLRKANELLSQEVQKLRAQIGSLKQKCESQEVELKKLAKETQDATQLASEESSKSKAAKEVIKTLTSQLKEMADKMPQAKYEKESIMHNTNGSTLNKDISSNETRKEEEITRNNNDANKKVQSLINSNDLFDKEWIEQYEPGVYITLMTFHDGTRDLKRVRFSRRRFGENQAESWWNENREKVYEKYNVRGGSDRISSASSVRSSRV